MNAPALVLPAWTGACLRRWRGARLWVRIAVASLGLLLAVQLAALGAIRAAVDTNARKGLGAELETAEKVWRTLLAQRATQLVQGAAVLAADFGFRDAVTTMDRPTIESALANAAERLDTRMAALLDPGLEVLATSETLPTRLREELVRQVPRLWPELGAGGRGAAAPAPVIAVLDGRPYQIVLVPMRAPVVVGWVLMGFEIGPQALADFRGVMGHIHGTMLASGAAVPEAARLLHSTRTVADEDIGRLAALGPQVREATLGGALCALRQVELAPGGAATLWLSASVDEAVAPYAQLQAWLVGLTLLGLAVFGLGSIWAARWVVRPLGTLVEAAERLGGGDHQTPVPVPVRGDEVGELGRAFETMRQQVAAQQDALRRQAWWDTLTGLPNRAQFREALALAVSAERPLAVVVLGLSQFKAVNGLLGWSFGDQVLRAAAERLAQGQRPGDLVARLDGDLFALLLPGVDADSAAGVAQRVARAFEQPLRLDGQTVDIGANLGVACAPLHAADADRLLRQAETAMDVAKRQALTVQLYDPAQDSGSAQSLTLKSELRAAVVQGQLRLFLQPKVDARHGALVGVEALVRWEHPERGLVPPGQFIPWAERTGFIRELTLWVVEEAARQQPALAALGATRVSVNLSAHDLVDTGLPQKLEALVRRQGSEPRHFCLEITESAVMADRDRAVAVMQRLGERGFELSIDDFGEGQTSISLLNTLPVQEIKIDRSLVVGLLDPAARQHVTLRHTIALAHELGFHVVAEGVENGELGARLAELGCDTLQGFHYGRPLPLPALQAWATARGSAAEAGQPSAALAADQPFEAMPRRSIVAFSAA